MKKKGQSKDCSKPLDDIYGYSFSSYVDTRSSSLKNKLNSSI
jgi:hypothetical protein